MWNDELNLVLVAGESSGDQLAAVLLQGAHAHYQHVHSAGIVGPAMQQQGAQLWWPSQSLALRGYFEPIRHLPRLLAMRRELVARVSEQQPDVFIGIDAPDFNLGVERAVRAAGVPTMHYVSPSIWAWRPKRIEKIRQAVDHMLLIFPFEQEIYERAGIAATYVGHPFAQQIPMQANTHAARDLLQVSQEAFVLALLPGSRGSEVAYNAPDFFRAAQLFAQRMGKQQEVICLLPVAHEHLRTPLEQIRRECAPDLPLRWFDGQARSVMEAADATLVASGTASLEVALYKKPAVISYKTSWLSAQIYPKVALQPWIGLPNILLQTDFIPEVLQDDATAEGLANALLAEVERYARDVTVSERLLALHHSLLADTPNLCAQAIETVRRQKRAQQT